MSYPAPRFPSAHIPPQYATPDAPSAYNPISQPQQGYPQTYPTSLPPQVAPFGYPLMQNFPQTGYYNPGLPQAAANNGYDTVRVIAETHRGTRGIDRVGDMFHTKDPLHLMFENKFQLVPDAGNIIEDLTVTPDRMIPKTPEEVAAARLSSAIQQRVHNVASPSPGDSSIPQNPPAPSTLSQPHTSILVDEFQGTTSFPFAESENVSKRFPKAGKNGMEIWKHAGLGYAINMIDPANPCRY